MDIAIQYLLPSLTSNGIKALGVIRAHHLRFTNWVKQNRMKTSRNALIRDAKRFGYVLNTGDATALLTLKPHARLDAMCALSNLARFRGCYPRWKGIIERYQLKWSTGTEAFNEQWISDLISGEGQLPEMLDWLRSTCAKLPPEHCNMLAYMALCGLRPAEVPQSLQLLRSDRSNYVLEKGGVFILQHFKYKQFQRKTKKALITLLTPDAMRRAESIEPVSLNALQCAVKLNVGACNVKWGRKIHGTMLRKAGLYSEEIDLLAGRLPKTVFERHYLHGGIDLQKFAKAVDALFEVVVPLVK